MPEAGRRPGWTCELESVPCVKGSLAAWLQLSSMWAVWSISDLSGSRNLDFYVDVWFSHGQPIRISL